MPYKAIIVRHVIKYQTFLNAHKQIILAFMIFFITCKAIFVPTQVHFSSTPTVKFDMVKNGWVVKFQDIDFINAVVIPQICIKTNSGVAADCHQETDDFEQRGFVECAEISTIMSQSYWQNSVMVNIHDTEKMSLCAEPDMSNIQGIVHSTNDWIFVTTPFSILIKNKPDLIDKYATVDASSNDIDLSMRLLVLTRSNSQELNIFSVFTQKINLHLNAVPDFMRTILVQNYCNARGLTTPKHAILKERSNSLITDYCLAECHWRYIRSPWNKPDLCYPIFSEFIATKILCDIKLPGIVNAEMISLEFLDEIDNFAEHLKNTLELEQQAEIGRITPMIVSCKILKSITDSPDFETIIETYTQHVTIMENSENNDNSGKILEIRRNSQLGPEDQLDTDATTVKMECLHLTQNLSTNALNIAVSTQKSFRRSTESNRNWLTDSTTEIEFGEGVVSQVSRFKQNSITIEPRVPVMVQRMTLVLISIVVVVMGLLSWEQKNRKRNKANSKV